MVSNSLRPHFCGDSAPAKLTAWESSNSIQKSWRGPATFWSRRWRGIIAWWPAPFLKDARFFYDPKCVSSWKTRKSFLNLEIRKLRDSASQCLRETSQSFLLWDTAGRIWDLHSHWQTLCNFPLSWVSKALINSPILNAIIYPSKCSDPL